MAEIDPEKLMEMGAATVESAGVIAEIGGFAQSTIDDISDLLGGGPGAKSRAENMAGDLAEEAGRAQGKALAFLENQDQVDALKQLATYEYWLPNYQALGDPFSDEFGAGPIGLSSALLERFDRGYYVAAPGTNVPRIEDVRVQLPQDGEFRGRPTYRHPSGLLLPESAAHNQAVARAAVPPQGFGDDAQRTSPLRNDPVRPPGWARWGARGLGVVGAGLDGYGAYTDQWARDQQYHPEMEQGDRIARATGAGVTKAGTALAGGWAGAKVGMAAGAAIGSIFPGPGTAIGGVVGGIVGGVAGAFAGGRVGGAVQEVGADIAGGIKDGAEAVGDFIGGLF